MLSKLSPRSILMVLASAVFGRLSTGLSQVVAAIYLSPRDFGIYAAAMAIITITTALRGGGTGSYVYTMTPREFETDGVRLFRYSMLFVGVGVLLTGISLPLSAWWYAGSEDYPSREIGFVMILLGLNFVVFNLSVFPRAMMVANLRLSEVSLVDSCSGFIKLASTWLLATQGAGPMALAAALLMGSLFEFLWTWSRAGFSLLRGPDPAALPSDSDSSFGATFRQMRLPLALALMISLSSQTDLATSSPFVPAVVLGYYFFASQLAAQPAMLVGNTLRSVFTSTTAHVRGDRDRENASIQTIFNGAMVFMPLVTMAIPAVFESLERAVWQGKWAGSRFPVLILSATLVYPAALQLIAAPIAGIRDWKLAIRLDGLRAASKIVAAALGGICITWLSLDTSTSGVVLAGSVGGLSALVASVEMYRILIRSGMPRHTIIYELYSTPLAALLSALAAAGLAHSIGDQLHFMVGVRGAAAVETAIAIFVYALLAMVLLRFGYTNTLERLVGALPAFLQRPARRLFAL